MNSLNNLLNGILESSKENVIFALDRNYCYLTFNENHRQTMKNIWDADIKVGDSMLDYIKYQEDRNKAKTNFDRALSGESFVEIEKYGDTSINRRWYQNEYNPLYDDSGTVIGVTVFLSDITEQKQAEDKIKKSKEEYETIFEASNSVMALVEVVDEETFTYMRCNRTGQKLTGYSSEEIIGKTPEKILGEDLGREVSRKYRQCLQDKTSLSYEETLSLPTGHRTFYTSLTPIFDEKGDLTHILDSSVDITERKQAEEELRKSEDQFRSFVEHSKDLIYTLDKNGIITYISPNCEYLLGYTPDEAVGTPITNYMSLEGHGNAEQRRTQLLKKDNLKKERDYRIETKNGGLKWFAVKTSILERADNNVTVLGTARDITERKELQEELSLQSHMTDIAPSAIMVHDFNGNMLYANQRTLELHGYSEEEFMHKKLDEIDTPESQALINSRMEEVNRKGEAHFEVEHYRKDGSKFPIEAYVKKINWHGKPAMLSVGTDITERKQFEETLKQSEEKFRRVFEQNMLAIYLHDFDGNVIDVNTEACLQLGYGREELLEMSVFDFIYTKENGGYLSKNEILNLWHKMDLGERTTVENIHQRQDGSEVYVEVSTGPIKYNNSKIIMALVQDITERKKAEESIRYMAFHDSLTGLYNRNYFEQESINIDHESQLPLGIIMADLNGLKLINDTYGSEVGDEMLKNAAKLLKNSCRKKDIIVRWGGDEFIILLPESTDQDLETICKQIKENCSKSYIRDVPISLALGVGSKEDHSKKITEAIKEAEDSMHREKLADSQSAKNSVLQALVKTLQTKSYETERHTQRMLIVAIEMDEKLGLSEFELNRLQLVITLHDIGKINISEDTLTKKDRLTDDEWEEIKKHPEVGYKIARNTEEFSHVAEEILSHHERWDGGGYPSGLKGENIPLLARITAIADAYEVMSNGRPYKEPMPKDAIIAEFKKCAGTQFDPELTKVFIEVLDSQLED